MRKLTNARKTKEFFSILNFALGKNVSLLCFSPIFACGFAHKSYQKATLTHSVILASDFKPETDNVTRTFKGPELGPKEQINNVPVCLSLAENYY